MSAMSQNDMDWFAARLSVAVYDTNKEYCLSLKNQDDPMSITGASHISGSIKDKIAAAKARMAEIGSGTDAALAKLHSAGDAADAVNKSIAAEADALMSELGQFSNGGPPLDDPAPTPAPAPTPLPAMPTPVSEPKKNESPV
jgi:hypothetical protein